MIEDRYANLQLEILKREEVPEGSRSIAKLVQDWGLGKQPQEAVWVIAYDLNGNTRTVVEVARGAHHYVDVYIPSVMTAVLSTAAAAFTLAHNHPTMSVAPSQADYDMVRKIMEAANACGLFFDENLIVNPTDEYFSFVDAGLLIPKSYAVGRPLNIKRAAASRSGK